MFVFVLLHIIVLLPQVQTRELPIIGLTTLSAPEANQKFQFVKIMVGAMTIVHQMKVLELNVQVLVEHLLEMQHQKVQIH